MATFNAYHDTKTGTIEVYPQQSSQKVQTFKALARPGSGPADILRRKGYTVRGSKDYPYGTQYTVTK